MTPAPSAHRLTLMTVHGHPDDETTTTGGIMARYAAEGIRVICVVATRGEAGRIIDSAQDNEANRQNLGSLREQELQQAVAALAPGGGIEVVLLGYRDSGMAGTPENEDPRAFCRADHDEAVGRLLEVIERDQPDVIVSPNAFGTDGHPDHVQAAAIAKAAFATARRAGRRAAGRYTGPTKLYEIVADVGQRRARLRRLIQRGDVGELAAFGLAYLRAWRPGVEVERGRVARARGPTTTRVQVGPYVDRKVAAMRAHRTQIAPRSGLLLFSPGMRRQIGSTEEFSLCASRIGVTLPETDLFAGLREAVADPA